MPAIIPIPAFRDNYIWLIREGSLAVVVDPGDAAPVVDHLSRERLELVAIIATHHHMDHVGGIDALVSQWRVPVFGPARESIPRRTNALSEGDVARIPGIDIELDVLDIPGHTAGHIALTGRVGNALSLFCGDTLFAAGCGRLFEGTPSQMWSSLNKLARLPSETDVYCGHEYTLANLRFALAAEPENAALHQRQAREQAKRDRGAPTLPSTMGLECETNPFLRAGLPPLRKAASARAGRPIADDVAAFAELRNWKNEFQ
jgi:hydroxyacylglutathione hydrolase